jgi:hypothetical protein
VFAQALMEVLGWKLLGVSVPCLRCRGVPGVLGLFISVGFSVVWLFWGSRVASEQGWEEAFGGVGR